MALATSDTQREREGEKIERAGIATMAKEGRIKIKMKIKERIL